MTKLCIIFDLDGTLIDSDQFDGGLYAHAVREVLGDVTIRSSWGDYEHVTDLGILRDICRDNNIGIERCASRVRESFGVAYVSDLSRHENSAEHSWHLATGDTPVYGRARPKGWLRDA